MVRCISHLKDLYKTHDIWDRAEHLAQKVRNDPTAFIANKYFKNFDNLDIERIRYMCAAENLAAPPPFPMGLTKFSLSLRQLDKQSHIENYG